MQNLNLPQVSLLDLYLTVFRRVMLRYRANDSIPTEHPQLDDNGDGLAAEVQQDSLDPDLKVRSIHRGRFTLMPGKDGALAARMVLHWQKPKSETDGR